MTEAFETIAMKSLYECLAALLDYPDGNWRPLIGSCVEIAANERSENLHTLASFRESIETMSLSELQEVYTRTFDLSPICTLDIGYHLFGENYKRGVFLANLREAEAPFDLGQEHQLPDYLPVLLRLLSRLDDKELKSALVADCMIPALEKMLAKLSEGGNPYRYLIRAVRATLEKEVGIDSCQPEAGAFKVRASLPIFQPA